MNNLVGKPFQPMDLHLIDLQEWERDHMDFDQVKRISAVGMMWSIYDGDLIIAITGFVKHWDGVYEVFVYPSVYTSRHPITYVRQIKRYLDSVAKTFRMRRQQTTSLANERTDRWMRLLGFVNEGTLVGYTIEGLDCRMWARFPKCQ